MCILCINYVGVKTIVLYLGAGEEVDARLPGKASKRWVTIDRTVNRHRWTGRAYRGDERTQVKELGKMTP